MKPSYTPDSYGATQESSPSASLTAKIAEKQRELSEMHELQIKALISDISVKDIELKKCHDDHEALVSDFRFNLTLITERDNELERFEEAFKQQRKRLHDSELALSEFKVNCAISEDKLKIKNSQLEEKCVLLNKRLKDAKGETLATNWSHKEEVKKLQETIDQYSNDMAQCLAERDYLLEKERTEITKTFETKAHDNEQEFRRQHEESCRLVQVMESKVRESARQKERALEDVSRLEEKLRNITTENSETHIVDCRKLWEAEEQVRLLTEKSEEDIRRHKREVEGERAKLASSQLKISDLEILVRTQEENAVRNRESASQVLASVTAEAAASAELLRGELKECTEKLNNAMDKAREFEHQAQKLESALAEQQRGQQQLLDSFEKQLRALEAEHKESVFALGKEVNERDSALLALTAAKKLSEVKAKTLENQIAEIKMTLEHTEIQLLRKENEAIDLTNKVQQTEDEFSRIELELKSQQHAASTMRAEEVNQPTFQVYPVPESSKQVECFSEEEEDDGLGPSISPPRLTFMESPFQLDTSSEAFPLGADQRHFEEERQPLASNHKIHTQEVERLVEENQRLRSAVSSMKHDAVEMREMMEAMTTPNIAEINESMGNLRWAEDAHRTERMELAVRELEERAMEAETERDKLMVASNALRGDLARIMSQSFEMGSGVTQRNDEGTDMKEYLESLEGAAKELSSRNTNLRKELRRVEKLLGKAQEEVRVLTQKEISSNEESPRVFEKGRIVPVRADLLSPAIHGLFKGTFPQSQLSLQQTRLSREELVAAFQADAQTAHLLLAPLPILSTVSEAIAQKAHCVLHCLGLRSTQDENISSVNVLNDVSATELVGLWSGWAAFETGGMFSAIRSYSANSGPSDTSEDNFPPPPPSRPHTQGARGGHEVHQGSGSLSQTRPPRHSPTVLVMDSRRGPSPKKKPLNLGVPPQVNPKPAPARVRNYNEMRPPK